VVIAKIDSDNDFVGCGVLELGWGIGDATTGMSEIGEEEKACEIKIYGSKDKVL